MWVRFPPAPQTPLPIDHVIVGLGDPVWGLDVESFDVNAQQYAVEVREKDKTLTRLTLPELAKKVGPPVKGFGKYLRRLLIRFKLLI